MPRNKRRNSLASEDFNQNVPQQQVVMSNEQFQRLLNELAVKRQSNDTPNDKVSIHSSHESNGKSFTSCTARFSGENSDNLEVFLDTVLTYKQCEHISDEIALLGLSLLLTDKASQWFYGVKKTIRTWEDAVNALRDAFAKILPPSEVFREIFANEQSEKEPTELFVCKLRALLAQLPYSLPPECELDIVYGLLHRKIRKRLIRVDVSNFNELLKRCRAIELCLRQSKKETPTTERVEVQLKKEILKCSFCRSFGHTRDECQKLMRKKQSTSTPSNAESNKNTNDNTGATDKKQICCYGCGAVGTTKKKCPTCQPRRTESSAGGNTSFGSFEVATLNRSLSSRPVLPISVKGVHGTAFADSGAEISLASQALYKVLQDTGHTFKKSTEKFSFADGKQRQNTVLKTSAEVVIMNRSVNIEFMVLPESKNECTLLGTDFLQKAGIVLNIPGKSWYFDNDTTKIFRFVKCHQMQKKPNDPRAIYRGKNKQSPPKNEARPNKDAQLQQAKPHEVIVPVNIKLRADEGSSLNIQQGHIFGELLRRNADIFRTGGATPTSFAEHHIRTMECVPKAVPPYPINGPKKAFLRKELDRLLLEGVIEECESPWASPVLLVPKPKGTYRLCVDYRQLNQVTVTDTYPMPRLDDLLHSAKSTKYMSTIDLQSGFWQVPVATEDKDKTCFVTPFGTFRFNRMPFGLKNAPMTFARLMDRFRAGLGDRAVFAYLDDILVLSDTFEQHIEDISAVFERLRQFNLRARREKCVFGRNSVKYLGHIITPEGISTDSEKVTAIANMSTPTCTKHVISFVQTCSWYRRFIPNFADIARPLTKLMKKGATFIFGDEQRAAFELLKSKLTSSPILIQADCSRPFTVRTDASNYAIGAVLLQGTGSDERPVEFASRLLTEAEKNYSGVEKEALAVVWGTEKFRTYIEGAEVNVASDCQPLQWLFSLKTPTGRLARWALRLQGLNMKISYTPGRSNVVADCLSRPFCKHDDDNTCSICFTSVEMPNIGSEDFRVQQLEDPEVKKVIDALESEDGVECIRWAERGFVMNNGVLYHFDAILDTEEPQLVLPSQVRKEVLKDLHNSASAGHYGIQRTFRKISSKFYFAGMKKYVADYVRRCEECQKYKVSNTKPAGLLQTPVPAQRFETIAVDLFGPLPETKKGNKWVLICEDTASKWVEVFSLPTATADLCAKTLIEEIFLRFGTCRKIISDNGVQFISDVMQQVTYCFDIDTPFIPVYHPESNPVERKNRELKTMLAILVQNEHRTWDEHLPSVRFAFNSTHTDATGYTPAYLTFGRELRAPRDCIYDFRKVVEAENFVPRITPYLLQLKECLVDAKQHLMREQDKRKEVADKHRKPATFKVGDKVLVRTHVLSKKDKGYTSKFAPRRDGPYVVKKQVSSASYILMDAAEEELGRFHASELAIFREAEEDGRVPARPAVPRRRRGRPKKPSPPCRTADSPEPPARSRLVVQRGRV